MTYLVTGATGFIGSKLVESLWRRGDHVHYLGRKPANKLNAQAVFHLWRSEEVPQLTGIPALDGIFHLAGEPIAQRWTPEIKKRIYESRVGGTRNLVDALRTLGSRPAVLVSASAIGFYGDRGNEVLTEEKPSGSGFLPHICEDWELEAFHAHDIGMRVVPVRISTVLGSDGGALKKMLLPFRLGIGGAFGSGKQWISWIHVDDLVRLLLFAADTPALEGSLNASSPHPVTNAKFTEALANAVHRPAFLRVPEFAMKLILGEMAEVLFTSQRVVPQKAEENGFAFTYPSIEAALLAALYGAA